MIVDYHIHTSLSDGNGLHEDYVKSAINKGVDELGFSDHFSILPTEWNTNKSDISEMKEKIFKLKNNDELPVKIKFGAEIDYIPGKEKEIKSLIDSLPLDYVIGSVHFIGNWNFDTSPKQFEGKNIESLYNEYFNLLKKAVESGLYDIVGHADLIKKFNHRPEKKPVELYERVIESIKKHDVVVEINTNGKNKPCKEFYPDQAFTELCKQYEIPVIISSDAHKPEQVKQYFEEAVVQLRALGYSEIATFTERKRKMVAIG
jgi:histidinol-phosphatase (PHP family)